MTINDGQNTVKLISVVCLVRDNEGYLNYALDKFKEMETYYAKHDLAFEYFFFENDSRDKSRELLQTFLNEPNRSGKMFNATLPDYRDRGVNFDRIQRIAMLRNILVAKLRPLKSDWTLLMDTDIYFSVNSIEKLMAHKPKQNRLAMICPYTSEFVFGEDKSIMSAGHYYDTFAFVDAANHNFWPHCNFQKCRKCPAVPNIPKMTPSEVLVRVRSAYGGFALIQTEVINNQLVQWKTLDLFRKFSVCEHIAFCDSVRATSGLDIAVAQDVDEVYWTKV